MIFNVCLDNWLTKACTRALDNHGIDQKKILDVLSGDPVRAEPAQDPEADSKPKPVKREKRKLELQECLDLIESYGPDIVRHGNNDDRLAYRCKICVTKSSPAGKINFLGEPCLKSVAHFLDQHVHKSITHKKNAARARILEQQRAQQEF